MKEREKGGGGGCVVGGLGGRQPSWHLKVKFHPDSDDLLVSSFSSFQHNSHLHGSHLSEKKCFVLKEEADCRLSASSL